MADITISELELTDDILDDMTIPVETPSKTFSATLKQLKNYIGGDLPLGSIIPNVGVLNDERFTLLDGKTLASNGTYAEFYRKAVENIVNGHWVQCTEEEFNSDVSNYGSCGKFVVTDEYIRIPKITKFIGATNILSEIGDTLSGNVPSQNITVQSGTGATVKALASDLKNTQSTHTKYYYYMKVSTEGQKEPIEIDINEVYEDLEIKANKDLSNLNEDGDNYIDSRITSIMNSNAVLLTGNQTIAGTKTFSSAVKCAASATTGTAVTTTGISKAQNGYVKLGNGIIVQWGYSDLPKNPTTITFPTAFTSTNYSIAIAGLKDSAYNDFGCRLHNLTTTTFQAYRGTPLNGVKWIAIGY